MRELIEALHTIQDECERHQINEYDSQCLECPLSSDDGICIITDLTPDNWKINDEVQKALLWKEQI